MSKNLLITNCPSAYFKTLQPGLLHAKDPMKAYEGTWKFTAEQAPINASVKDNILSGTAASPDDPVSFSATRVVKEKK